MLLSKGISEVKEIANKARFDLKLAFGTTLGKADSSLPGGHVNICIFILWFISHKGQTCGTEHTAKCS